MRRYVYSDKSGTQEPGNQETGKPVEKGDLCPVSLVYGSTGLLVSIFIDPRRRFRKPSNVRGRFTVLHYAVMDVSGIGSEARNWLM